MNNCEVCFVAELPECIEAFTVKNADLQASHTYRWRLTDKFDNRVNGTVETDGDGIALIEDSSFIHLLRSFSGTFTLRFYEVEGAEPVLMTICDTETTCIAISFYSESGDATPAVIGCD